MNPKGIILLTLVGLFTLLSWIVLIPFVSNFYTLKQERALLAEVGKLPLTRSEREAIEKEALFVSEGLSEGALQKGKRSLLLLAGLPFFAKLLFASTFLLMLMLLRRVPDSEKGLWLLPLLSILLLFTLPKNAPSRREALYPKEESFPKDAFSSKEAWEKAWGDYLTKEWQGEPLRLQVQLIKEAPLSQEGEKPLIGPLLTLFFLFWTSYSAYQLNRRSAS